MRTRKERSEMTLAELIKDSNWWLGTEKEWQAIPLAEREEIAFIRTGCLYAYPTWQRPVDCVHTQCCIRRGELPAIVLTNRILRSEAESGWLRFLANEDRSKLAHIFRVYRKAARAQRIYDPWKLDWQLMVVAGINA